MYPHEPYQIKDDKLKLLKRYSKTITFKGKWSLIWYGYFIFNIILTVGQTYYIMYETESMKDVLEVFLTLVFVIEILLKLSIMYIEQPTIRNMHRAIEQEFWDTSLVGESEEAKLVNHFDVVFNVARFHYTSSMVVAAVVMFFPPTQYPEGQRNLSMLISFPFDHNVSPLYEFLFGFFALNGLWIIYTIYAYDYLFIYFAQHLIVQFKLLKIKLADLTEGISDLDDLDKVHSDEFQTELYRRMSVCVQHHIMLMKFGKNLAGLASIAAGLQSTFSVLIGVTTEVLIGLAMDKGHIIRSIKLTTVTFCMYNEMSIFSYHGSELQEMSTAISKAIYSSEWYLGKIPFRKAVLLIQLNAYEELKIMGFKLFEINNNTIITLARTTFSIVTLIRAVHK